MSVHLEQTTMLAWAWLLLVPVAALVLGARARSRRLEALADAPIRARLEGGAARGVRALRAALVLGAAALLVLALLDPRWGEADRTVRARGIDVMLVVDASRSMLAEDASPDRLERARSLAYELMDASPADRFGVVAFAGTAVLRCPLTVDRGTVRTALEDVDPERMPRGGSLLGDALRLAASSFTDEVPDHKAIVVLTDGEDHGSFAVEAAARVREEHGIPIFTIGIGDRIDGGRIPIDDAGGRRHLVHEGQEVWSKLDDALLEKIARAGGGAYVPAGTLVADMARFRAARLAPIATRELQEQTLRRRIVRYQWFVGAALALLLVETLLRRGGLVRAREGEWLAALEAEA